MSAEQRANVQLKYESLYTVMGYRAAPFLRAMAAGGGVGVYPGLKEALQTFWGVSPDLDARSTLDEIERRSRDYAAVRRAWREGGREVSGTNAAFFLAQDRIMVAAMLRHMPPDCDAVVDLGCGWGHRMFDLRLGGGPPGAAYWGGERAPQGLKILRAVAQMLPEMNAHGFSFDFTAPDLRPIVGAFKSVLVYTFHAVEQVYRVGPALIDAILERFSASRIVCVHLEPIGFQAHPGDPVWEAERVNVERKRYNVDLLETVRNHPRIQVRDFEVGVIEEPAFSTTKLVWTYTP